MRLSQPMLGSAEIRAVRRVMKSEYLGMGKEVDELEQKLSQFFGNPVVCVNTGTAALQLALSASGIKTGDEVLVPSLTYVATYQAISAIGAIPVSCDVQSNDLQIDVNDAAKRITKLTKAIIPVYYSGATNCADRVQNFAQANNILNIPDAAHAFGSSKNGVRIGSGKGTCIFSLDGIKNITGGEGGVVVSDDPDVIAKVRDSRLLGVVGDSEKRNSRQRSWDFDVEAQGWRYHMSDLFAAIAKTQLEKIEKLAGKRIKLFAEYNKLLQNEQQIELFDWDISDGMVPHIFVIRIPGMTSRHTLRQNLLKDGIPTGIHYKPNHLLSFFQSNSSSQLTNTELLYPEILTLPLHPRLKNSDLLKIVTKLRLHLDSAFE